MWYFSLLTFYLRLIFPRILWEFDQISNLWRNRFQITNSEDFILFHFLVVISLHRKVYNWRVDFWKSREDLKNQKIIPSYFLLSLYRKFVYCKSKTDRRKIDLRYRTSVCEDTIKIDFQITKIFVPFHSAC